ncbi:MAG TPA: TonB-dependent receptor [Chryseolinea sp.]|nr:TonB-dependent receptor [Chryseolinea sp.]
MKKTFTLIFCIGFSLSAVAQNPSTGAPTQESVQKGHARVYGSVMDAESNQPVEFANIALIDPQTNKPVDGSVADDKGKFNIVKVVEGTYNVSISFIGYETQEIKSITVDRKGDVNLGIVKISSSEKVLNEVVVEGQRDLIEERVDRTIYNAENDQTARGGDATDVLKRVPMLSVDLDGNVSLRGSQNVTVLINNKPSTIMASSIADALKQIPADQIKSVEVITSPSAKYDAEGTGGIINIITKKNTLQGATLNIDAGAGLRGSNLGLNGNYRKGKMGFSLGGFGRSMYNVTGSFDNSQLTRDTIANIEYLNLQRADNRSNGLFGNYTLGWDYDIDKKNSLAASVRFGARNNKTYQDNLLTEAYKDNTFTSSSLRDVMSNDLSNTIDVNLTYTHLYEKPQKEFSLMALYSKNNRNNDFENRTKEENGAELYKGFKNLNDSYNQEITIQADYQTPIGTNQMIEIGGKDIMRKAFSDYTYLEDADGSGVYFATDNSMLTNNLNYDQNIVAGYLSYTVTLPKGYSFKAGTRYEYTTIDAYSKTEENIEIPSYGVLVPSANLSKKLKSGTVKLAYNRRIQRPSIQFLNPNVQASNQIDISSGNPELDPEYTNNYELGYSTFIKGTSLNFTSFVRNTTGSIQRVRQTTAIEGQVLTTFQNIGTENAYGMSVFANVNIGKLSLNGGGDIYYAMLDNNIDAQNEGWVASGRVFGSYNLTKGWGIQFFSFMRGRDVQLQGTRGGFGMYSLGIKKDLKDKKGSIGFGAENFFTPNFKIRSEQHTPTLDQNSLTIRNQLSFRVNFSYRIGKMNVDGSRPKRRRSIDNDDLKDGGGDNGGMEGGGQGGGQQRGGGGPPPQNNAAAKTAAVATLASDPNAVVKAEGSWTYTVESPQGGEGTIVINKEGANYSGSITNKKFNSTTTLKSVTVKGNELSFEYDVTRQDGNTMSVTVKSVITGDTLSGAMSVGQFGTFPIKANRAQ